MRVMVRLFFISSIYIPRRKSQRGIQPVLYPVCWFTVSALINGFRQCVTASVTESAQADAGQIFPGSRSPVAVCRRAALMIGLPLCLQRSGYLSRFACAGLSPVGATQPSPLSDSNRPHPLTVHAPGATWHIKARQLRVLHFLLVKSKAHFN